jgi:hypothetical protein
MISLGQITSLHQSHRAHFSTFTQPSTDVLGTCIQPNLSFSGREDVAIEATEVNNLNLSSRGKIYGYLPCANIVGHSQLPTLRLACGEGHVYAKTESISIWIIYLCLFCLEEIRRDSARSKGLGKGRAEESGADMYNCPLRRTPQEMTAPFLGP